ncbi:glycosyltransferase [Planococcus glaciei]|uniref:glycosyltransferase n=1 Tax=Planococcus glaciei TaxID=459472 RepID=UPI001C73415E|nr:glycosyltransferase [Planococcus glaciei]MBX0313349.1 glycosyltransferase [Planococcus glaciei]
MNGNINVLMVGSSTKVKGGMTTVVQSFLQHEFNSPIKISYIATHTEKGDIYNFLFFVQSLGRIFFHLLFKNPLLVHLHMSERGSFVRKYIIFRLAKLFGKKVIIHTHGAEFKEYFMSSSPMMKKKIMGLLKNADRVLVLGESWEMILRSIEPEAKTTILMNSVPIPVIDSSKRRQKDFHLLFLAVLIERKGILDLIEASVLPIMQAKKNNLRLIFHIAGDGELMEAAKKRVSEYNFEEFFHFYGWVNESQKKKLLKLADLFILPSYNEGLPMSILEALSYGIPVISTKVGSIDEAIVDGVNGYLIEPGDIHALSMRISELAATQSLMSMRQASRKIAEEKFGNEQYFKEMEKIYLKNLMESSEKAVQK